MPDSGEAVRKGHLGNMSASRLIAFLLLGLSACTADSGPKEVGGTAVGAVTGGLIGNAIGGSVGNRAAGTVIGAAIGGLFGNRIGAAMDDEDRRRAYAAEMQAWKPGRRAPRWLGEIRNRAVTAMWCPVPLIRPMAPLAGNIPTQSMSTAPRRARAAPPAAIPTAPGPLSIDRCRAYRLEIRVFCVTPS